jgi:hypothetical protein
MIRVYGGDRLVRPDAIGMRFRTPASQGRRDTVILSINKQGGIRVKKWIAVLAFSGVACATALAGEMTGYISDTKCANEHSNSATASGWIHPKVFESCAKMCAKQGSETVFLTEDNKIVHIDADSLGKVMPHLGHKVKLNGSVENGKLKVDSISTLSWD